jgi:hypothetical protein
MLGAQPAKGNTAVTLPSDRKPPAHADEKLTAFMELESAVVRFCRD